MLSNHRGYFAVLGIALITSVGHSQFTQVTGTASDFVPEDQVRVDAQLEKEGRLILTKALGHVPLTADQKTEVKEILDGRTATEKTFREIHKVPNATVRAFNLEQTRLAIVAIHQILTPDQWDKFCAAQIDNLDTLHIPGTETVVVEPGVPVSTVVTPGVIVLPPRTKIIHEHVKVVKVIKVHKAVKHHKLPKRHPVKVVHPIRPVHPHIAPAHRAH